MLLFLKGLETICVTFPQNSTHIYNDTCQSVLSSLLETLSHLNFRMVNGFIKLGPNHSINLKYSK